MKRIAKLLALALTVILFIGCISAASAVEEQNGGQTLIQLDSSSFSYDEHGVKLIRFMRIESNEVPVSDHLSPGKQTIYPIDRAESDSVVSPYANPERTATEVFSYGIYDKDIDATVGAVDIVVNGVWSQADGYGRVVDVGYTFYDCVYGNDRYSMAYSRESDSTVYVYIYFDNPGTGVTELMNVLKVVQYSNGDITCEMVPN